MDDPFVDANHALLVGEIAGLLMAVLPQRGIAPSQIDILYSDNESAILSNKIRVTRPSGSYTLTVTKDTADDE